MSNLVVVFGQGDEGVKMVALTFTKDTIKMLMEHEHIIEPSQKTGVDCELLVVYKETQHELMSFFGKILPQDKVVTRNI